LSRVLLLFVPSESSLQSPTWRESPPKFFVGRWWMLNVLEHCQELKQGVFPEYRFAGE